MITNSKGLNKKEDILKIAQIALNNIDHSSS